MALLTGDAVHLLVRRNAGQSDNYRYHFCREQSPDTIREVTVQVLGKVPLKAAVKLFRGKTGFQINDQPAPVGAYFPQVTACTEDKGT